MEHDKHALKAILGFDIAGVETFPVAGRPQVGVSMFCVMATIAVNQRVVSVDGHVVNSSRENLNEFLRERHTLFPHCPEKEGLKFD